MRRTIHHTHKTRSLGPRVGYNYCIRCGLVYLRNKASIIRVKQPCPDYDGKIKTAKKGEGKR